jgi:hypothetical protein
MANNFLEVFFIIQEDSKAGGQEDRREIPNIAYTIVLDELWYFTCPSCPRDGKIASDHLKSYEKKRLGNRWILNI